jgi:group I intron endonuclease
MQVYVIINKQNGRAYVGKTTQALRARWRQHQTESRLNRLSCDLYRDMRALGFDAFIVRSIAMARNEEHLQELEVMFMRQYEAVGKGYNTFAQSRGGARWVNGNPLKGRHMPKARRQKISKSVKANRKAGRYGKVL